MSHPAMQRCRDELAAIEAQGLFKRERIITSPQAAEITLADGRSVQRRQRYQLQRAGSHVVPDVLHRPRGRRRRHRNHS